MKPAPIKVKVTREITYNVLVTPAVEWDDDGCGSPSMSGNGMTGCRGKRIVVDKIELADVAALEQAAMDAIDNDDDDIAEAIDHDD